MEGVTYGIYASAIGSCIEEEVDSEGLRFLEAEGTTYSTPKRRFVGYTTKEGDNLVTRITVTLPKSRKIISEESTQNRKRKRVTNVLCNILSRLQ